ncbi:M28 family peptidase [Brachybacterium sp. GCM10030252]|uniref:M28 family peptidase n=1 Tax=Brachybacterium sp. GCM10030252 TaxID=3273380 RepID=UPI0036166D4D
MTTHSEDEAPLPHSTSSEPEPGAHTDPQHGDTQAGAPGHAHGEGGGTLLGRWQGLALLVVLLAAATIGFSSRGVSTPVGADASSDVFSAARASEAAAPAVAEPRPVGSDADAEAHALLSDRLAELGFETTTQESIGARTVSGADTDTGAGFGSAGYTRNLVATRPGTDPTGTIVLGTHIDSVPNAPGAADAGVGLAVILETVRALGPEAQRNDLVILLVDGEEPGLLGSQAFVDAHAGDLTEPVVVLNHEARGVSGRPTVTRSNGPMHPVYGAMPHPEFESLTGALFEFIPNDTDFTVYREAGWWGMDMAITDDSWAYHSPQDDAAHLDRGTLQHYGDMTLALTRDLAQRDLGALEERAGEQPVQTTAPWGIIALPPAAVGVISVLAPMALLAAVLVRRRRGELTLPGVLGGVLAGLGAVMFGAGAGALLWEAAAAASPEMLSQTTGEPVRAELFFVAELMAAAAVVAGAWVLARILITRQALLHGAAITMLLLLTSLGLLLPGLGMAMILPAAVAAIGALAAVLLPPAVGLVVRAVALVVVGWTLGAQISALMEFGIASSAGGLAGTTILTVAAAAPLFLGRQVRAHHRARRPHRVLIPVLPAVLAIGLTLGASAVTLASPEPIQERVTAHVDGSSGQTTWEATGTTDWGEQLDGTTATTELEPLTYDLRADTADGRTDAELTITAPRDASEFLLVPEEGTLTDVTVDGTPVRAEGGLGEVRIVGVRAGQTITIEFSLAAGAELTVRETIFEPSLAGGWTEPAEDVSLVQPRVTVSSTIRTS